MRPVKNSETLTLFLESPDQIYVRSFVLILVSVASAMAESHPSWWGFASPEATAMVGIRWEILGRSAFAEPIQAELYGSLGFPDLPLLREARQIVIASPATIAMLSGNFSAETLRAQAADKGWKTSTHGGIELWITPGKDTLSVAQISEQLVLLGSRRTLESAIDRSQAESRRYSPLLERGARWATGNDLWVVATRLPDPLASLFVPFDAEARGFDGGVSVSDGVQLDASLDAGSEEAAATIADELRRSLPELPAIARGMKIVAEADRVVLSLEASRDALIADLRTQGQAAAAPVEPKPAVVEPKPPADPPVPAGPQVIRIYGLDDGVREIVLPGKKPEK